MAEQVAPLWAHQQEGIRRMATEPDFALFFEMGTGKTRTIIEALTNRWKECGQQRTLIFCPPVVIQNWVEEWRKFTSLRAIPLFGSGVKRLKSFTAATTQGHRLFITNYESLSMKPLHAAFMKWQPQALVFDESHKLKSPSSQRSKLAESLANPFDKPRKAWLPKPNTFLLSGSPVLNSPTDLFQQFLVMDGGQVFGRNFWAFRAKYFRDRNAGMPKERHFYNWQPATLAQDGFDALAEITRLIAPKSMRVLKKDCLDLPPEIYTTVKCAMTPDQTRFYQEMKRDLLTYHNSKACVATLAITKALRLLEITAGFLAHGEPPNQVHYQIPSTPKTQALEGLLESICEDPSQKVIVWAVWRENYKQIASVCEKLKLKYVEVHGEVSGKGRDDAITSFNTDPECRVFVGHPGSGGIGINLVVAGHRIFYSRNFSLEQYLQACARNHRGGSKEAGHASINHYDLVCENTIDELCLKRVASKQDMSDNLLSDLISGLTGQGAV